MKNINRIRKRLISYYEDTFPKKCENCNKIYNNKEEMDQDLEEGQHNQLIEYDSPDEDLDDTLQEDSTKNKETVNEESVPNKVVANYATCKCGSTLFLLFKDRRDSSGVGKEQRHLFESVQQDLEKYGLSANDSAEFVRNLFRNMIEADYSLEELMKQVEILYTSASNRKKVS